jgi:subtilisin family serine protease
MRKMPFIFNFAFSIISLLSLIVGFSYVLAQGKDKTPRLVWKPTPTFEKLEPNIAYASDEILAIYNLSAKPANIKRTLDPNGQLVKAAEKAGLKLLNAIPIPARFSDPGSQASQVCGKILVRFAVPGSKTIKQAVSDLDGSGISILGADAVYGVAPNGFGLPSQTSVSNPWIPKPLQLPSYSNNGKGIRVAVLDTGVTKISHLNALPGMNSVYPEAPTSSVNDDFTLAKEGHGTGVASVIAGMNSNGAPIGIAPQARIVPVKVCRADGHCTDASVVIGVCYAVSKAAQARVLNVSLGSFINSPLLEGAIRDASLEKALVVVSAGNTRDPILLGGNYFNFPLYPAAFSNDQDVNLENLISVGAVDPKLNYASFATAHKSVDMVAPGVEVRTYSRDETVYTGAQGTSYAAPFVSGTAALMFSKNSSLFPAQVKEILKKTADPSGCNQVDPVDSCGAGLLNVAAAVTATP